MTTWANLLADIRVDLKDTGTTNRWTDAALLLWAKDAIRDYSQYFPRYMSRVALTLVAGKFALPSDFISAINVECPLDRFMELRQTRPGNHYVSGSRPAIFYIEGGYLYLDGAPLSGDAVLLTYHAYHTVPADNATVMTFPDIDGELVRLYIRAKANEQIRGQQSNLDRFKPAGDRSDNPLMPEFRNLMDDYRQKIADRTPGGVILLYKPGRTR
jgi:hypothetical protein